MADINDIVDNSGDDTLYAAPGTNDIVGGPGNDTIYANDGLNTIHYQSGDGVDSIKFALPRTYQYARFLTEAVNALADPSKLSGASYSNSYFSNANAALIGQLPSEISSTLSALRRGGSVASADARTAFSQLVDWINAPAGNVIQFGPGIKLSDVTIQVGATADFGASTATPVQFAVALNSEEGMVFGLEGVQAVAQDAGVSAPPMIDMTFQFADGTSASLADLLARPGTGVIGDQTGTDGNDFLHGSLSDDTLMGNAGNDKLDGGAGADRLFGGDGDDVISGGSGDDAVFGEDGADVMASGKNGGFMSYMSGGAGDDVYCFNRGDGLVTIDDQDWSGASGVDTLSFGNNVALSDLVASVDPVSGNLVIGIVGTSDAITIPWFDTSNGMAVRADAAIERVQFFDSDGTAHVYDLASLVAGAFPDPSVADPATGVMFSDPGSTKRSLSEVGQPYARSYALTGNLFPAENQAPTGVTIADQTATEDTAFRYVVPFVDPEGTALAFSATAPDGGPLPSWLQFNNSTGEFTGTPSNGDVGTTAILVTATDLGGLSSSQTFNLDVQNVNDTPTAGNAITDQKATQGIEFSFTVPVDAFADVDKNDTLTYSAKLTDGSALPAWLQLDPGAGVLNGIPANADVGALDIELTATDSSGASVSQALRLSVDNVNDAPTVGSVIANQSATQGVEFAFTVPSDAFADIDNNDTLTYSAKLRDGSDLPTWLRVDSNMGTLKGVPSNADVGELSIELTATDSSGAHVSQQFGLNVVDVNDAPTVVNPISDQSATQGTAFSFKVPTDAFADIDKNDSLIYTAKLDDGAALPSWLQFDQGKFSGTPGSAGQWNIELVATDTSGASVSDFFTLTAGPAPVDPPPVNPGPTDPPPADPPPTGGRTIHGTKGNDKLYGTPGDDRIEGGKGADLLSGAAGDDILYYSQDGKRGLSSTRKNAFTGEKVSIAGKQSSYDVFDGGSGYDVLMGTNSSDAILLDDSRNPRVQKGARIMGVEKIDSGGGNDVVDLTSKRYSYGDVEIDGGDGNDVLWSSSGNDILRGGSGNDRLDAAAGNDYLEGGAGNDRLDGRGGVDLLQGGGGVDALIDTSGNGLLDGGSGNDSLTDGSGNSLLVGGKGNDHIHLGGGYDIIAFNRGDGRDVVSSGKGGKTTLSLGGGIRYEDLSLRRVGNDLILETGSNERITFEKWYAGRKYQAVSKLQLIAEGMAGFDPVGHDAMRDNKIETFDFTGLVTAFDAARSQHPGLSKWTLTNALAQFQLGGSDSAALGGDLAYQYGINGTLAGIAVNSALSTVGSSQYGKQGQALQPQSELKDGLTKLS